MGSLYDVLPLDHLGALREHVVRTRTRTVQLVGLRHSLLMLHQPFSTTYEIALDIRTELMESAVYPKATTRA